MGEESTGDLWWKNTVIYCLDVETYLDVDGDGVGDFVGLTERTDYLAGLGVRCIWLMPFYRSANRDDGYDIVDYYSVDPRLGDMGDFTEFVRSADAQGIRVIADLVVNHTSSEHPWFQASRSSPDSPFREFYVWRDEPPEDWEPSLVFPGEQNTNWTFDKEAGQYYFHHFYSHQPDLNADSPRVRDEMSEVIGFWLQQGIHGFRVDAVPFLVEMRGGAAGEEVVSHGFLRELGRFTRRRRGNAILLGEVNLPPFESVRFFGDGGEMQLLFNFFVNQHLYLALARENPDPLRKALRALPPIPESCAWANFIKNHDEQNLDQLTHAEREEVFAAFGPDPDMQTYGRGIRRRLPGMLEGDGRRLRMAYSLMFSLPGVPVLFYGEEIGMAENLAVEGRLAVRTPMQWHPGPTGGFSLARPQDLLRPPPEGDFGPDRVNVRDQRGDPESMLNWMERLVRRRNETAEFGFGAPTVLDVGDDNLFAVLVDWDGKRVVALHNFSAKSAAADISAEVGDDTLDILEIWADRAYVEVDPAKLELDGYGYRWLRLRAQGQELLL